jgi:hypothetical protein
MPLVSGSIRRVLTAKGHSRNRRVHRSTRSRMERPRERRAACSSLGRFARDEKVRQLIAKRIIAVAINGERENQRAAPSQNKLHPSLNRNDCRAVRVSRATSIQLNLEIRRLQVPEQSLLVDRKNFAICGSTIGSDWRWEGRKRSLGITTRTTSSALVY